MQFTSQTFYIIIPIVKKENGTFTVQTVKARGFAQCFGGHAFQALNILELNPISICSLEERHILKYRHIIFS